MKQISPNTIRYKLYTFNSVVEFDVFATLKLSRYKPNLTIFIENYLQSKDVTCQ